MKKNALYFLLAAIALMCSDGLCAQDDYSRFEDGIYYRPSHSKTDKKVSSDRLREVESLVTKTTNTLDRRKASLSDTLILDSVLVVKAQNVNIYNINSDPWYRPYWGFGAWFTPPWYGSFWSFDPWFGPYDPWYYRPWAYDPWYGPYGPWYYRPWGYGPWGPPVGPVVPIEVHRADKHIDGPRGTRILPRSNPVGVPATRGGSLANGTGARVNRPSGDRSVATKTDNSRPGSYRRSEAATRVQNAQRSTGYGSSDYRSSSRSGYQSSSRSNGSSSSSSSSYRSNSNSSSSSSYNRSSYSGSSGFSGGSSSGARSGGGGGSYGGMGGRGGGSRR